MSNETTIIAMLHHNFSIAAKSKHECPLRYTAAKLKIKADHSDK